MGRIATTASCIALIGCAGPSTIDVEVAIDPPDFVAYRDGSGPWRTPKLLDGGSYSAHHYELEVSNEFEFVVVWVSSPTAAWSAEMKATVEDGSHWYLFFNNRYGAVPVQSTHPPSDLDNYFSSPALCGSFPTGYPGTGQITGRMTQAGYVSIGNYCSSSAMRPWTYAITTTLGSHDVFATDLSETKFAITRDVDVVDGATGPDIDLNASSVSLAALPIAVTNTGIPDDMVSLTSSLVFYGKHDAAFVTGTTEATITTQHAVSVIPPEDLLADESQAIWIRSGNDQLSREARTLTLAATYELLDPVPATVTGDTGFETASWTGPLPNRIQRVDFNVEAPTGTNPDTVQHVTATRSWLQSHQASSTAFDADIPGYDASWNIAPSQTNFEWFTVSAREGDVSYLTSQAL